jgi:hypothetical protein
MSNGQFWQIWERRVLRGTFAWELGWEGIQRLRGITECNPRGEARSSRTRQWIHRRRWSKVLVERSALYSESLMTNDGISVMQFCICRGEKTHRTNAIEYPDSDATDMCKNVQNEHGRPSCCPRRKHEESDKKREEHTRKNCRNEEVGQILANDSSVIETRRGRQREETRCRSRTHLLLSVEFTAPTKDEGQRASTKNDLGSRRPAA